MGLVTLLALASPSKLVVVTEALLTRASDSLSLPFWSSVVSLRTDSVLWPVPSPPRAQSTYTDGQQQGTPLESGLHRVGTLRLGGGPREDIRDSELGGSGVQGRAVRPFELSVVYRSVLASSRHCSLASMAAS